MPNCEECAAKLWNGNKRAFWFLVWLELLILPRCCSRGHEWKFSNGDDNEDGSYCHLHCTARLQEVFPASEEADEKAPTHKRCNYKKTWRNQGDLPYYLPASMTPSQKQATLKREIETHVLPGSLIFTDRHKSYHFLGRRQSQYVHRAVNHKAGEFSRMERIFGQDINVTTNAVEGLFGRLKKYLRQREYLRIGKRAYGEALAEFLWRQRCSAFRLEPFYNLLREIKVWQDAHPRKLCPIPPYQSRQKQGNMKEKSLSHQLCSEKRNAREYDVVNVTCDSCGVLAAGKGRISPGEAEQARLQQLREEKERLARLQQLREEKERLLREQAKQTRLQQLREEKERLLQEQAEQTRLEQLRLEAKEQLLKEQAEQTRLEKERLMQQQAEQARLPELRQAAPKPSITCGTQATDTLIDRSSQPSSQPIFPAADRMSPGEETIDRALRDEESMQIQRALSREALEEEQAVLKLKELQAQEARDAEEMAKLEARMQQRQLESQAQAKAALLARSRGATKQKPLRDFVLKCYKQNDYEGSKESRLNKVKGAMQYCTRHKLTKRCKYTNEEKFLVELEDKVDDELMTRLKLEEEMSAISGDLKDDDPVFAFNLPAALEDDDQGLPASSAGSKKVVLEEWPEILEDNLSLRIKKFNDHAVKRKGVFKHTEERLLEEKCAGHEKL
ncbi:unnamed protein product, partial [Symbiodinium microadriaticum]